MLWSTNILPYPPPPLNLVGQQVKQKGNLGPHTMIMKRVQMYEISNVANRKCVISKMIRIHWESY